MFRLVTIAGLCFLLLNCKAFNKDIKAPAYATKQQNTQEQKRDSSISTRPQLVVGVVVDQMRYDYLNRFWDKFSDGGFKRLIGKGFLMKNCHYNYVPTYTGPGHASIYTGTTPKNHGIISNNWFDKFNEESIYCVDDREVRAVGTQNEAGQRSPHRMITSTLGDQNRLFTQFKGKTIGVALKDRSAILPSGHTANAAYWFHGEDEGRFISSSYYLDTMPQWVKDFNNSGKAASYLKTWTPLMPLSSYTESGQDDNNFEYGFKTKSTPTFPYDLKKISETDKGYDILKSVPYGNNLTVDFALSAIEGEDLGQDTTTDVLTVSFSSPDYIGHNFGPNSKEIEDNYIRLDRQMARMIDSLDQKVGKGNYTLFLTADHGAVNVPAFLKSKKFAAGYFDYDKLEEQLNNYIGKTYGTTEIIKNISNNQIFLDHDALDERNLSGDKIQRQLQAFLLRYPKIQEVYTRQAMLNAQFDKGIAHRVQKGFNQKRSGDLMIVLRPAHLSGSRRKGTTHGTAFNYDTHIPLIFYGKGIEQGASAKATKITDIVPTMASLIGIPFPNAATGDVLTEVIEKD